jgi:autotransporter-associated beta strand protein
MTKAGTGTLTLGGVNTYSGGTLVSSGRLVGSTTSLQGNVTNNAALTFSQSTNGTFSSVISGSGSVVKDGSGEVTLSGANSYSGGTLVSAGTLIGTTTSLQGSITNNASVTFNQSAGGTYSSVMSGTGGMTKSGAGTLTMSGVNTFSGATTISAGELVVNGTNASSAVTVSSSTTLSGSGQVGGLTVSGLLSPGNSIGTLSAGSTTFNGGGSFQLEIFDWTSSGGTGWDLLAITGDLTLNNTSLNPFTIDLVSFSDGTTPGFSVNFNANQSFTNTFVTFSGSLLGESFAANLFTVSTNNFLNPINGAFSITNMGGGLALLYTTSFDPGASYVWNAGSGDWTVAGNWEGNVAPANDSLLVFTGGAGTATNNAAVTSVTGLKFSNTTGSIVLAGDAFALGVGGIENDSANAHTISNNLSLTTNASILAVSNGLTIAGNITNDTAAQTLTVGGAENTTISGVVSGQGDLSKIGLGTLTLSGANTFTGSLAINGGEAIVSGSAATTTIAVNVGGTLSLGAADALANGATVTVDAGTFNTATFNDTIGTLVLTNGGTVSGSGGVLSATTFTLINGTVAGALGSGTADVTGAVSLTGTMASTTVNLNSGGTLTLGSADRLGDSTAVVIGGGTLALGANNDTVGSFSTTSGTLGGTGTLTAATYALGGGTVSANLGAGTATAASGTTALDGTLAGDLTVSGGIVNLGAADRLGDASTLTISSGTLGMGANNDTVSAFSITGGTLDGTGILTAASYALNGGTIGANLGAGAATVSSGSTTLNGSLDATTLAIDGGTLALGSNGRINNNTAVTLSGGVLDMGTFLDGVGSFTMTGGTVDGTGTLSSVVTGYDLQSGTINANLGAGTATVSSGTVALNGSLGGDLAAGSGTANVSGTVAGSVTVSGGTVNISSADRIADSSAVSVSSGTLDFAANDTVGAVTLTGGSITGSGTVTGASYDVQAGTISAALGGAGAMTKTGAGTTTLSANNSGYSGAVAVNDGAILAGTSGALGSGTVAMTSGSTLAASGVTLANDFTVGTAAGPQAYYTQNFNDLGAGLPTDWTVRTGANASSLGTTAAFNTAQVSWADTGSGFKNYASATGLTSTSDLAAQNASTDRALGVRQSSSFGDPGASFNYAFSTTGEVLDSISLDLMVLDVEARSTTWSIEYGIGAAPTSFTLLGTWTDPGAWGTTTLTFDTTDFGTALDNQANLVFRVAALSSSTGSGSRDSMAIDNFEINAQGPATGSGTLGIEEAGTATFSGNIVNNNEATFTAASGGLATFSGIVSGAGTMQKTGAGTVTLSGASANTFSGMTTVSAGTLQLDKTAGTDALAGDVTVNSGATLLISASNQVNDNSAVSLSGGTITRGSGLSEVFGNLIVSGSGFLDFGTGTTGTLSFAEYTPSALLTVNNFGLGNELTFGTDLTGSINNGSLFAFDNGFTSSWSSETSTFTITAIPEPSTYLAAAGLLSLMLWPSRKRIVRDAKKILGLTPPMRDKLAARSKA